MVESLESHQRMPTMQEMARRLGISANAIAGRIEQLRRKGWIRHATGRCRSWEIVGARVCVTLPSCQDCQSRPANAA